MKTAAGSSISGQQGAPIGLTRRRTPPYFLTFFLRFRQMEEGIPFNTWQLGKDAFNLESTGPKTIEIPPEEGR
jgi:hypothetical protein